MSDPVTLARLQETLDRRYDGVLTIGIHYPPSAGPMELLATALGQPWALYENLEQKTRTFDLRILGDISMVDDAARTWLLLPVIAAYAGSWDWPADRQRRTAHDLACLIVRELLSRLPDLSAALVAQCQGALTLPDASAAASAVRLAREHSPNPLMSVLGPELETSVELGAHAADQTRKAIYGAIQLPADEDAMRFAMPFVISYASSAASWMVNVAWKTVARLRDQTPPAATQADVEQAQVRMFGRVCSVWRQAAGEHDR